MIELIPYTNIYEDDTLQRISDFFGFHHALIQRESQQLEEFNETLSEWCTNPNALFIIMDGDVSAGFVRICYRGPNVAWIEDIFVDSDKRKRGIGSAAILAVDEIVKAVPGYTAVCLDVSPRNTAALRLYYKLGYADLSLITVRKELRESKQGEVTDFLGLRFSY